MSSEPMSRVQELFLAASKMPQERRQAWLAEQCAEDEKLFHDVVSLLKQGLSAKDSHQRDARAVASEATQVSEPSKMKAAAEPGETNSVGLSPEASPEPNSLNLVGKIVGPYKLLQRIGEGGMGTVYMADQEVPVRRRVALKIIKPGLDTKQVIARFEAERQALAMMDHNNIARVLDAGATDTGHPYFAMELVKGIPITKYCDDNKLTVQERLELFVPVCHAIQHAHQKGIIHRDIKPSNVLICMYDRVPVAKVIDFGVAKATHQKLTEKTMFTALGQVVGTLEYMSPEQAEMNQLDVDTRTDIYSLGVMLYELLTGMTPITSEQLRNAGFSQMLKTIREHEPPKPSTRLSESGPALQTISSTRRTEPSRLSRLLRGDLDWIVMKSLEKDRTRRYETANGLAADIRRYLSGDPVEAGPPSATYRLQKLASKYRSVLAASATITAILIIATTISGWAAYQATKAEEVATDALANLEVEQEKTEAALEKVEDERDRAVKAEAIAERSKRDTQRLLYRSDMREAVASLSDEDTGRIRELLLRHLPEDGESDNRDFVWHYLWSHIHPYELMLPHGAPINDIELTEDESILMSVGSNQAAKFWDLQTGRQVGRVQTGGLTLRLSPNGEQVLVTYYLARSCDIRNWRTESDPTIINFGFNKSSFACWMPNGTEIVSVSTDGSIVRLIDSQTGQFTQSWTLDDGISAERCAVSPDGTRLAYGSDAAGQVRLLDLTSGSSAVLDQPANGHVDAGGDLQFSRDSRFLATCGREGIEIWDVATGSQLAAFTDKSNEWKNLSWRPDGKSLFAAAGRKLVELDARDLTIVRRFAGHANEVTAIRVTQDGKRLISAGLDGTIQVRSLHDETIPRLAVAHAEFLPDGNLLACFKSREIHVVDPLMMRSINRLSVENVIRHAAVRGDGHLLAVGHDDGRVSVWDIHNQAPIQKHVGRMQNDWTESVRNVAFQPRGNLFAICTVYNAYVLGSNDFELQGRYKCNWASALAFSPDQKLLAVGDSTSETNPAGDQVLRVYDLTSNTLLDSLHRTGGDVQAIAYSTDSRWLASAGSESVIRVSTTGHTETDLSFRGHTAPVTCLAFSPDNTLLVSGADDGSVRIWSIEDKELIADFPLVSQRINSVGFSKDGRLLAVASDEGLQIFNGIVSEQLDHEIKIASCLSADDWPAYYAYVAQRESRPDMLLNAVSIYYQEAVDLVNADRLEEAMTRLDLAEDIYDQIGFDEQATETSWWDRYVYHRVLMTKVGCCVRLGRDADIDRIVSKVPSLDLFDLGRMWGTDISWALDTGLGEIRRRTLLATSEADRFREYLRAYLNARTGGVSVRKPDGTNMAVLSLANLPEGPLELVGIGFPNRPVHGAGFNSHDSQWLAQQEHLTSLCVDAEHTGSEFWDAIASLKNLETLVITNWTGKEESEVQAIGSLSKLRSLSLDAAFVGFDHLPLLRSLPHLEKLSFTKTWLSAEDAKVLPDLPYLKSIELSWSSVDDDAMAEIASCEQLEALFIDATLVSIEGIKLLEGHRNLRRVDVFEMPFGDEVADSLSQIPNLQFAGLVDTEVSLKGIGMLREALPECLVMHNSGYLNIARDFKGEMVDGSAPDEVMYFPPRSSVDELLSTIVARAEANEPQETLSLLTRICVSETDPQAAREALKVIHSLPSPFNQLDWNKVTASLPALDQGQLPPLIDELLKQRIRQQTCIAFSGENSRFDMPIVTMDPAAGVTFEAWARPESFSGTESWGDEVLHVQTGPDYGTRLNLRLTDELYWALQCVPPGNEGATWLAAQADDLSQFVHLAAVLANGEISLFVNGKQVGMQTLPKNALGESWKVRIGSQHRRFFQGLIDEVRVSNAARYSADFSPQREFQPDDQTIALYHFDANPFGLVYDHSSQQNHRAIKPEFVGVLGADRQPATQSNDPSAASGLEVYLSTLKRVDPAELPIIRPMVQYQSAPPRDQKAQTALKCDGKNSDFQSPRIKLDSDTGITIESWVKPEQVPESKWGAGMILANTGKDSQVEFAAKISQSLDWIAWMNIPEPDQGSFLSTGQEFSLTEPLEEAPWTHVACVIEKQRLTIYVNGELAASGKPSTQSLTEDWIFRIGGKYTGQKMVGLIDEVRISDTARYSENFEPQREFEPDCADRTALPLRLE